MDNQPMPPQSPSPGGERPTSFRPEDLQVSGAEQAPAPRVESAPAPGASPAPQQPPASNPPQKMSRDDVVAAIAAVPGPAAPGVSATPGAADDVDVIEPEWVNAAEHVIAQHQGDPYGEEEAIEDLNRDYLEKRYGYHVADPDEGSKK